jgi:trehalose 6-phosphate synthase/phosphatase
MSKQKFIIISNRLPVSVSKVDGELVFTPSSGGLATAMSSLKTGDEQRLWIGWPGIANEDLTPADKTVITRKLKTFGCAPVYLTRAQVEDFYAGYSNATLWPLFHYFQSYALHETRHWQAYRTVNRLFAQVAKRNADSDATIWVHDYHFLLLPKLLREVLPESSIGFFLHIPFPSFEIFRLLPNRREILEGLLGADLVGFHTYDYASHFMHSVLRTLGLEYKHGSIILGDRTVTVDAFPIGIDYEKFAEAPKQAAVRKEIAVLDEYYKDKKIILSVDRLDYSKGISHRLEAFEQFLKENPRWHKKVVLAVVAVPSRTEVQMYQDLRDQIEQTVSRINGQYATVDWTPISYQFKNLPFEQLVALYAKADTALLTPLRDGMNLVAKEYITAKQRHPGVLILSEMTGAVDELPEALRINPNDTSAIVQAIKSALIMPKSEQRLRLRAMQRRLSQYTVQRWASDFLEQLEHSRKSQMERSAKLLTNGKKSQLIADFHGAKKRMLFLDYDGTLRNFVTSPDPSKAGPSKPLLRILAALAEQPNTEVCIISGRPREALDIWFGNAKLTLIAEHGAWIKQNGEWAREEDSFDEYKRVLLPILNRYAERTAGARVEEKTFSLVWHYRNVPPELAYARNTSLEHELNSALSDTDVGVFSGHKIIEIKPRSISKGAVVGELYASDPADFVLCIGDDYTDEDMFRALPDEAYTVKVGFGDTGARYQLPSVEKVLQLLRNLL